MAKTRFTEIRLERITDQIEAKLFYINENIAGNIMSFCEYKRTAAEARRLHSKYMAKFIHYQMLYYKAIDAANEIDHSHSDEDRHRVSHNFCTESNKFITHCEFFKKC